MTVTFRQIEAFHAVIATGGVTSAAALLELSQPAVSRLIAELEGSIGFPLFLRTARTMKPTLKARELHREVERSFLGMSHIDEAIERLRRSESGQLRVAVVPSLVRQVMADLVGPFARTNPCASISLEVQATLDTADALARVHADIGITNEPLAGEQVLAEKIGETVAVCVMPPGHRLARLARALRPRDFAEEQFVSFMPVAAFRKRLDRAFADAGVQRRLTYEARTTAAAASMAVELGAVTIVPAAGEAGGAGDCVVRPFAPMLASDLMLVRAAGRSAPAIAERFVAFARANASGSTQTSQTRRTRSRKAR